MFEDTTPFVLALVITFTILLCIAIWNSFNAPPPPTEAEKPAPGPSRTREILARFSEFYINLNPEEGYIYDTALLPDPKQHIIHALYVGFDESETDDDRDAIQRGIRAITNFQELVGEEPLSPNFNSNANEPLSSQLLFQDPSDENQHISDEEKKYNDFKSKVLKELQDHFNHLKLEIDLNQQEESSKENV